MQPQNPNQPQETPQAPAPYPPQPEYTAPQQPMAAPQPSYQPSSPMPGSVAEQYPVDYLNQIAGKQQVKKVKPAIVFGLIGAVLLLVIGAFFFMMKAVAPPNATTQLTALSARLDTLTKVSSEQSKKLTQNELSSINSTLGASLTSMTSDLAAYMKNRNIKSDKSTSAAKNAEKTYYEALSKKLNDSYLTGTLDRTFATEMTYQLSILKSKMQRIKSSLNSKSYNTFYDTNIKSLDTTTQLLSDFQSTK